MRQFFVILLILGAGISVSACGADEALAPTPTPTLPAGMSAEATFTPVPGVQPPQGGTDGPVGPDSYPAGVNPLTGLVVADASVLDRAPLAIKISNDPLARPQSGLSSADLVFEHYAEGGIMRYTAIFYSQAPEYAGSVRSGRLVDLEIVPMFDAIFASSGFSNGVLERVLQSSWVDRNFSGPYFGEPYLKRVERSGLAYEHTMFASPADLWALAEERGVNNPPDLTPGLAFSSTVPANGTPASSITLDFSTDLMRVRWDYDPASGLYLRTLAGKPDNDYLTNTQISASNVLLISAMNIETDILEDNYNGLWSIEIQIWGEGQASLYRDGMLIPGKWSRNDSQQMLQFTDLDGNTLYLKPGITWFELVPYGFDRLTSEPQ